MFSLTIRTGSAAFMDLFNGEYDSMSEAKELQRILHRVMAELALDRKAGVIMDLNGNKVGEWQRTEPREVTRSIEMDELTQFCAKAMGNGKAGRVARLLNDAGIESVAGLWAYYQRNGSLEGIKGVGKESRKVLTEDLLKWYHGA